MGLPWPLWPPLRPTMAATAMVDTVMATAMARGPLMLSPLLMPRPSLRLMPPQLPTMVLDTDTVATEVMAVVCTVMARGPLMPMPTTAMADMAAMEVMAVVCTDTARGPLMPMPTTAMADMAVMADTDTARGPLTPMPTMVPDTDMAVMAVTAVATDMATASKCNNSPN